MLVINEILLLRFRICLPNEEWLPGAHFLPRQTHAPSQSTLSTLKWIACFEEVELVCHLININIININNNIGIKMSLIVNDDDFNILHTHELQQFEISCPMSLTLCVCC